MTALKLALVIAASVGSTVVLWALIYSIILQVRLRREADEIRRRMAEGVSSERLRKGGDR